MKKSLFVTIMMIPLISLASCAKENPKMPTRISSGITITPVSSGFIAPIATNTGVEITNDTISSLPSYTGMTIDPETGIVYFPIGIPSDYTIKKDGIYTTDNMGKNRKIPNMDRATLRFFEGTGFVGFVTDKNHVYFNGVAIPQIDRETARILSGYFIADKNGVYGISLPEKTSDWNNPEKFLKKLSDIDPTTFVAYKDSSFLKDKNNVYVFDGTQLPHIDIKTFRVTGGFGVDAHGIYDMDGKIIKMPSQLDLATFIQIIPSGATYQNSETYFKDKNNVYYIQEDPITESNYAESAGGYIHFVALEGADPLSFEYFPGNASLAKDKNAVYYSYKKIAGIDPSSSQDAGWFYIKDKNGIYIYRGQGEKVTLLSIDSEGKSIDTMNTSFDIMSFSGIADHYAIDKNHVYFYLDNALQLSIIRTADAATFESFSTPILLDIPEFKQSNGRYSTIFGKDKDHYYSDLGKIVPIEIAKKAIKKQEKIERDTKAPETIMLQADGK